MTQMVMTRGGSLPTITGSKEIPGREKKSGLQSSVNIPAWLNPEGFEVLK